MLRWMVCILLLAPTGLAQVLFEDPEGDHEMGYTPEDSGGEPVQWMSASDMGWFPYADVLEVGIVEETEHDLVFRLKLASWTTGDEPESHRTMSVGLPFTFRGEARQATFWYELERREGYLSIGFVEEYNFNGQVDRYIRNQHLVPAEMTDDGLVARFPKELLQDSQLVPARAGDVLKDITVLAEGENWFRSSPCIMFEPTYCWRARDVVEGTHSLELEKNPPGVGHLLLFAEAPNRASNGEATTYLFNLTLRNIGQIDDRVRIQVGGQPGDWVVHAPATLELPKGETKHFPVAVSVPFKHKHGQQEEMEVRVASTSAKGIEATATIGVVWHEVPQPGGHHQELYLHSNGRNGWMNTLAEDPDATTDAEVRWNMRSQSGQDVTYGYRIPLSPRLLMGLDFEAGSTVSLDVPVNAPRPINGTLTAQLELRGRDGQTLAQESQGVDLEEGYNVVPLTLPLQDGVDRLPFDEDNNLWLDVRLAYRSQRPFVPFTPFESSEEPTLSTDGARMRVPLQEYHDIIDKDLLASLGRLSLQATGDVARLVNPDRTVAIPFDAANAGHRAATIDWHIEGTHAEWARVVPQASEVPARGNASVLVTISPPQGTADGAVAQLLLIGQDRRDPDVQVFARLVVTVTTTADIPDEADQAKDLASQARESEAKKTPGLGIVAALVAVALAWRRR